MNNIIMENTTVKKKRGRKPKNKEIVNENPVFDNVNKTDVIVKLNLNNMTNNDIELDNNFNSDMNYSLLENSAQLERLDIYAGHKELQENVKSSF